MTERIHNFSAGPAVLPLPVLEEAQRDMLSLPGVEPFGQVHGHPSVIAHQRLQRERAALAGREVLEVGVFCVEEKSGELVYAHRLRGDTARPPVFAVGNYTVKIGDPDLGKWKTLPAVAAVADQTATLEITV